MAALSASARIRRADSQRSPISIEKLPYVAVDKNAFPSSPACSAGRIKSSRLPKQAQVCCVSFQAQYQAFVHSAVTSSAALQSRSIRPAFWNLFLGTGSRCEKFWPSPAASAGPATLDRRCERNVVAPGEYSKRFFAFQLGFIAAISGPRPPAECRPDRLWEGSPP
jgi:hypothetical protein